MELPGQSLIKNLYATLIAAFWPIIALLGSEMFRGGGADTPISIALAAFVFVFFCDDYYAAEKAYCCEGLVQSKFGNVCRFWIDILILVVFVLIASHPFFDNSASKLGPYLLHAIWIVYLFHVWWSKLLIQDYKTSDLAETGNYYYVHYLKNQSYVYFFCIFVFATSEALKNIYFHLMLRDIRDIWSIGIFRIPIDWSVLYLLWALLAIHWVAGIIGYFRFERPIPELNITFDFIGSYSKKFRLTAIGLWFLEKARQNKFALYFVLSLALAFVKEKHNTVHILVALLLLWYLFQISHGKGLLYKMYIRQGVRASGTPSDSTESESRDIINIEDEKAKLAMEAIDNARQRYKTIYHFLNKKYPEEDEE